MLRFAVSLVVVAACGRGNFDNHSEPDASPDALADTPALGAMICKATTIDIASVEPNAEIAAYRSATGYHVAWNRAGSIVGATLDAQLAGPDPETLFDGDATGIAGIVDTGEKALISVPTANGSELWALATDLTAPVKLRNEAMLPSREPFASDSAGSPRIWVRGGSAAILGAFFHDDGAIDNDGSYTTGGPVTSMGMEDGPDHSHVTWTESLGPHDSRCYASDIRYGPPNPPIPTGSPQSLSDDCYDARTASGPDAADSMIVVWQTEAHTVEARYLASTGDIMRDLSFHGRMPRVKFDGTEFWITWIDEGSADVLHLASFDLQGNVHDVALPDWHPVGDQAFQLVRRGATVYLVVLSTNTVNFLLTCA